MPTLAFTLRVRGYGDQGAERGKAARAAVGAGAGWREWPGGRWACRGVRRAVEGRWPQCLAGQPHQPTWGGELWEPSGRHWRPGRHVRHPRVVCRAASPSNCCVRQCRPRPHTHAPPPGSLRRAMTCPVLNIYKTKRREAATHTTLPFAHAGHSGSVV